MSEARWLTPQDAAKYLQIHVDTLRRYRRLGTGPSCSQIGRLIRYHTDELDAWLRSHQANVVEGGGK